MPPNSGQDSCLAGIGLYGLAQTRVDPKGVKWVITYEHSVRYGLGIKWVCETDVEVHLFAYVGYKPPKLKRGTHTKRGVVFQHASKVYWSYRDIVCQEEDGFTTTHTFIFFCYPPNPYIWWRCGGRTTEWVKPFDPIWSASRSPFYHRKCFYDTPLLTQHPCANGWWPWNPFPPGMDRWDCINEEIPDGDATYVHSFGCSSGVMYGNHTYAPAEPFYLTRVVVSLTAKQEAGPWDCQHALRPGLRHKVTNHEHWVTECIWMTYDYQTIEATFWVNPETGQPWSYPDLDDFDLAFYWIPRATPPVLWGDTHMTQMQAKLYVPE